MVLRELHELKSDISIAGSRRKLAESDTEKMLIRFPLTRQSKKTLVTAYVEVDFINDNNMQIDRFWLHRFAEFKSERSRFNKRDSSKRKGVRSLNTI
jgi:hypothetical protein